MTTNVILNYGNIVPNAVKMEEKPDFEKLHLVRQLQEDDKQSVYKIIDTTLPR